MSHELLAKSIAPSTHTNYHSACSNFLRFCATHNLPPFPPKENTLILYVTQLSTYSSHANIKMHLAAIRHYTIRRHFVSPIPTFQRLYLLIKGIKRTQGPKFQRRKRDPITPPMLVTIKTHIMSSEHDYVDKLMLWAALLTAFFGFLRVSEYTSPTKHKYDPSSSLLTTDLTLSPTTASLHIKSSKTDPFRTGVTLRIAANNTILCPISALYKYVQSRNRTPGPLFQFRNGSFLTRRDINKLLSEASNGSLKLSSHS